METNIIILDETAKNSNSSSVKIFENPGFGTYRSIIVNGSAIQFYF